MRTFASEPWSRPTEIVIGIDIGTTQTAVSFAYLYPDGPQSLTRVSNWPGQEAHKGESKIPSLIYYNKDGEAVCFGAEALKLESIDQAAEEGWQLARHFKLHLHPSAMTKNHMNQADSLPEGVSLSKIYQDFLSYVTKHTQQFFESHVVGGKRIWTEHNENKVIVLSHPNGWALQEQSFLRSAAVQAGCIPESKSLTHIRFVSEAEASVHFCMYNSNLHDELEPGEELLVCDAGGSTVDITSYGVKATSPMLELEERKISACVQAGAVFIDQACRKHIASHLASLGLQEDELEDCLRDAVADFEGSAKRAFESPFSDYRINLGSRLTRPELQIRKGILTISGKHIRSFFDDYVEATVCNIRQQMQSLSPKNLLLVGGFGDSPYLRLLLSSEFNKSGCVVTIGNDASSKAVADGAVIWCAKLSVVGRATRTQFGTDFGVIFDPQQPEHVKRRPYTNFDGKKEVSGAWSQIIDKGVIVNMDKSVFSSYRLTFGKIPKSACISTAIFAWTNADRPPDDWILNPDDSLNAGFEKVCDVQATLTEELPKLLKKCSTPRKEYFEMAFRVALTFGGTELLAHLQWEYEGKTFTSPATIVPNALKNV